MKRVNSTCFYGGDLVVLPLSDLIKPGKGDDIMVTVEGNSYGCLRVDDYPGAMDAAKRLAASLDLKVPVMIAVEDPESASPMILTREVVRGGRKHYLALIFNAIFSHPEENRNGSFCLRMSERYDPERTFSERIMFAPGKQIVW